MDYEKIYREAAEQRDAYARLLGRLIYSIRSGFYNNWDLNDNGELRGKAYRDKSLYDGKFNMGPCRVGEWEKVCDNWGAYHLGRLLEEISWAEIELDAIGRDPREVSKACDEAKLDRVREDVKSKKPPRMEWPLRKIAAEFFVLMNELPVKDEEGIYGEALAAIWYALCEHIKIDATDKAQIINLIHELNPKIVVS